MDLFNFSTDAKKIAGYIGYFNLGEWWLSEFSESERYDIQDRYMGVGTSKLIDPRFLLGFWKSHK
ncbi:MAG: hypothetical protein U5L04_00400 [Trueperaceae bacterium]|nr:hypothetical protein [Trueperaceae bacterium]